MIIRPQRFIALLMVLSPWIYIPLAFKEVIFIALGVILFMSTLDIRKKKVSHSDMPHTQILSQTFTQEVTS